MNIIKKYKDFEEIQSINIFADMEKNRYTFEVCIYNDNTDYIGRHRLTQSQNVLDFMLNEKAEAAYRLLEHLEKDCDGFKIPSYIEEAIKWIKD